MKHLAPLGLLADSINDSSSTRTVYLIAAALAVLGVGLLWITVWFWKSSKPEPQFLAPLETMEQKKFRELGRVEQKRLLDSARPPDAEPLHKTVVVGAPVVVQELDLRALGKAELAPMDDLKEDAADLLVAEPSSDSTASEGIAIDPLLRMFDRDEI